LLDGCNEFTLSWIRFGRLGSFGHDGILPDQLAEFDLFEYFFAEWNRKQKSMFPLSPYHGDNAESGQREISDIGQVQLGQVITNGILL
jgi:hypothetical protein